VRKQLVLRAIIACAVGLVVAPVVGAATIVGTPRADSLETGFVGAELADRMFGRAGSDTANGGSGNDRIHGNAGGGTISGEAGNDRLFGNQGSDVIMGESVTTRCAGGLAPTSCTVRKTPMFSSAAPDETSSSERAAMTF
jgi:hypothetical protein